MNCAQTTKLHTFLIVADYTLSAVILIALLLFYYCVIKLVKMASDLFM